MRITKKKAAVVLVVASVAMAGAGGAYAFWTTGGTGSGTATAGTNTPFNITQDAAITGLVLGVPQTVNFTVANPAGFAQYLTGVSASVVPFTAQADATKPACTAGDFTVSTPSIASGDINAGGTRGGTTVLTLVNKATNQDNCKGASISLAYTAS